MLFLITFLSSPFGAVKMLLFKIERVDFGRKLELVGTWKGGGQK